MKKIIFILLVLILTSAIALLLFFNGKKSFVSIKANKFILNEKEFYPLAVNYCVSLQMDAENIWACPSATYNTLNPFPYTTKDSCLMKLKSDMHLIKAMGFNSVRICRVGEPWLNSEKEGELSIGVHIANKHDSSIVLSNNEKNYSDYFNALDEMYQVINDAGLKVILLLRMHPDFKSTEKHLVKISSHFKDEPTIMAYDFYNEPLYGDHTNRTKKEVFTIVKNWSTLFKKNSPKQLSTIGLEGIGEVFEWDPNILDIDFISYHPYEYEYEQVRNEIYWYGKHTKKPWIIGETAIPADNDSMSYKEQYLFAKKTLKQTRNCGGLGYSWWQFKDVEEQFYHASYMGVITQKEKLKPVTKAFRDYDSSILEQDSCVCLDNYHNLTPFSAFKITGQLVNDNNEPIDGGAIVAWNKSWSHSFHALSKADGSFELTSKFPFYHWMISATEMTMVRGNINPAYSYVGDDKTPFINLGKIKLDSLSFIK